MLNLQRFGAVLARGLAVAALLLIASVAVGQDDAEPLRLSEVNRMLGQDQTPAQIVAVAAERGVGFGFTRSTLRRLEEWGFTEQQIDQLRKIAAGEDPGEIMVEEGGDAEDADGGGDGEAGEAEEDEFAVGYREGDGVHDAEKARIERAIAGANLGYERIELARVTLYCPRHRARALAELLRETEQAIIRRFPPSIANATDPRSAHIVVVDGDSQWANWLRAFEASYAQDGITFPAGPEGDFQTRMGNSPGYTTGIIAAIRGDLADGQTGLSRQVTYHLGHLIMNAAARPEGFFKRTRHDGLVTGFGDLVETMAMGSPSVMVYSYTERDLDGDNAWGLSVRNRFRGGEIRNVAEVWNYSTDSMAPEHYAEAWSMVSLLCEAPEMFAEAVLQVQRDETAMADAVRDAYDIDDRRLFQGWQRWANQ